MLSSLVVQRPFSCKTEGATAALPRPLPGGPQGGPGPTHPFALLGGAVEPRHHLVVQQEEECLVCHLRRTAETPSAATSSSSSLPSPAGAAATSSCRRGPCGSAPPRPLRLRTAPSGRAPGAGELRRPLMFLAEAERPGLCRLLRGAFGVPASSPG